MMNNVDKMEMQVQVANMRCKCIGNEIIDILRQIEKHPDNLELWKFWRRLTQRYKNANARYKALFRQWDVAIKNYKYDA